MQSLAAHRGQTIFGLRPPAFERLGTADVACFLQLACMRAEIPITDLEQRLELIEGELLVDRQRAHDSQAHTLVDQAVEPGITDEVYKVLSLDASVKARMSFGGTAPDRVREQLFFWREKLR